MPNKNVYLQIRISDIMKEKIRGIAESENKTISEYLLDLVKIDIAKKEQSIEGGNKS